MKRNKKQNKLDLRRNVIRRLVDIRKDDLEHVNGGARPTRCSRLNAR